jgi:2-haloacid dehalogenase
LAFKNHQSMDSLASKKVLTFDCYGTLIDWESAIIENIKAIWPDLNEADDTILGWFADAEHNIQSLHPTMTYQNVLQEVIKRIASKNNLKLSEYQSENFGASIKDWKPFDDTVEALQILSEKFKLVIVSNIDNESIAATKLHLKAPFFKTFTAQDIGAYKPDQRVFQFVFDHLSLEGYTKGDILHVAESLYHDHVPAKEMGFSSVWINRRFAKTGSGATPTVTQEFIPELVFNDLISFARWVTKL